MNRVKLRIGIHKSGILNKKSISLLNECGLYFNINTDVLKVDIPSNSIEIYIFNQGHLY